MFQLIPFFDYSQRRRFFFLPNICGSNHDLLIRTRNLSRSILLPPSHSSRIRKILFNQVWIFSFGIRTLLLHFYLLFFISFLPSFLNSHKVWSCRIWPIFSLSERYEINQIDFSIKSTMWNLRFFLFLYPYPIGTAFESIENLFLLYESILLHSNSLLIPPKENPELDPKLTG